MDISINVNTAMEVETASETWTATQTEEFDDLFCTSPVKSPFSCFFLVTCKTANKVDLTASEGGRMK